jgi:hypothetical protein
MNGYVTLVYAVALALLWGYGAALWLEGRKNRNHGEQS